MKCELCDFEVEELTVIHDAEQFPDIYNGKKICDGCRTARHLLKNDSPE